MKYTAIAAMVIITFDCIDRAMGIEPQYIFSTDHLWVWWIIAICWAISAIGMCYTEVK